MEKKANKDKKSRFGFGINDCPIWLFKTLDAQAKSFYNDQYWVVLADWCRKAEAYDRWMEGDSFPQGIASEEDVKKDDDEIEMPKVKTFGK